MPKQFLKINDFSGGVVDAYDPRDLKMNEFAKIENLMLDKRSSLTTFGGEKEHQDIPSGDAIVICPGYGLFSYDTDHMKGDSNYAKARDEGEHWMAVTDAINGTVDLFDLSNGSVVSDKITLGTPRSFEPGLVNDEARIQVVSTTATPPSGASPPYKSDTIFLNTIYGLTQNFKFPDGDGSTWSFKVGDIVNISGHVRNTQNNLNALRIKSLTPATTYGEEGSSYLDDPVDRTFVGLSDGASTGNWAVYKGISSDSHTVTIVSEKLKITVDNSPADEDNVTSGAKLPLANISSGDEGNLKKSYVVSARLYTDSGAGSRDNMYFRLGNATSDSFSINETAKYHSIVLNPTSYVAYDDGTYPAEINSAEGLVIYSTATDVDDWFIDDINITRDGVFMQFEHRVLYRTDNDGLTGGEYGNVTTAKETSEVVLTLMPKTVFHFVDEALRISDATLSTGTAGTPPKNKWWGYIKRTQFDIDSIDIATGVESVANEPKRIIDGWFSSDNDLPAPTEFQLVDHDDSSSLTYPGDTPGSGFDIHIRDQSSTHNDNYGTWLAGDYECALSFIYDGNQESLLYPTSSYSSFSVASDDTYLTIKIGAESDADGTDRYDERVSGGRVYARKEGSDDDWQLLCEIDIKRGARVKPFGEFTAWADGAGNNQAKVESIYSLDPNIDTYETLNGFSQNEKKITVSGVDEGYKTSIVANRRCFVANVKTQNKDGETIQMRDRIMYSPINKFDVFPRSFFIDAVKGDAEEYIKLEEYADRLLAFKNKRLHIINIQDPSSANWFLEDVKDYAGVAHHSATVKTEFGIVWVNREGCYHYDGKSIQNLIMNKIAETTWESFITTESSVFYNPQKFYVCVLADYFGGDRNIYLYDFRTKSWIKGSSAFSNNQNRTNFTVDWNGNPTVVFQPLVDTDKWEIFPSSWESCTAPNQGWTTIQTKVLIPREWSDDLVEHQPDTVVLQTKDYDFGEPSLIKKVYAVTVTYASDSDLLSPISYAVDGSTSFNSSFTGDFAGSGTGSGWKKVRATLSSPVSCQSIALKISNPSGLGTTEGLKINDITLEYRALRKRVS